MNIRPLMATAAFLALSCSAMAEPMPNTIIVEDKAVVPILKTEVVRRVAGQDAMRQVEATVFEVSKKGEDIVVRDVVFQDDSPQFSDRKLPIPRIEKGGVIVPTSKIEVTRTLTEDGQAIGQMKEVDATGVEFKKGQKPAKRTLHVDQMKSPEHQSKVSHAIVGKDGHVTKDIVVIEK